MSIEVQLAELFENRKLPMTEYKKLSAFRTMEKEMDIVEKLEAFHLPEITKLICGSEILATAPWADKYQKIRPLYCTAEDIDPRSVIVECETESSFESDILCFADFDIWKVFYQYYEDWLVLEETKRKEKTTLMKKVKEAKKKLEAIVNTPVEETQEVQNTPVAEERTARTNAERELLEAQNKLAEFQFELNKVSNWLGEQKGYIEKIRAYESKIQEADSEENREKAYAFVSDIKESDEEKFLKNFIITAEIPQEYYSKFYEQSFVDRMLQCLEQDSFQDYSLPILLKLYEEGVIDLIEGPASDFIEKHPESLCEYLMEKAPQSLEELKNPEFEVLFEKAIQKELSNVAEKETSFFANFWNTITDQGIWKWIIAKINEMVEEENLIAALNCLLFQLDKEAAKSVVEVLFDDAQSEVKLPAEKVISCLLENSMNPQRDIIIETICVLEQNKRKTQRKLNFTERNLRSQSQELFSSIYAPMEQLEELAINLKLTDGNIKAKLVATKLIDLILSLREGLETFDLQPVVDMEDWKFQNEIKFVPDVHRVTANNGAVPDVVRLRSLGFRYQDEDGKWQEYPAQASVKIQESDTKIAGKHLRKRRRNGNSQYIQKKHNQQNPIQNGSSNSNAYKKRADSKRLVSQDWSQKSKGNNKAQKKK